VGRVALSFDNGPHPEVTPRVLDVLAEHAAPAHFFVLGHKLAEPGGLELAQLVRDAGHTLGNHSYSHATPLGDDPRPDAVELELGRTQRLLEQVSPGPRMFRPFGGGGRIGPHLLSPRAVEHLVRERFTCVLWTSVPGDWLDPDGWVDRGLRDADGQEHTLVVLHDFLPEAMKHLSRFLHELAARGHTFTRELPATCLPIVDGEIRGDLSPYVNHPAGNPGVHP
jgi:peptidoglycan/xylan/chitin deacetylase (PgdA/CDA1 family)